MSIRSTYEYREQQGTKCAYLTKDDEDFYCRMIGGIG